MLGGVHQPGKLWEAVAQSISNDPPFGMRIIGGSPPWRGASKRPNGG